ncbi:Metaxin-like protein [Golovinomyces cichoracearum]|uniref:Metaxin-like protein n=1 Tax=Golovinomyces cichoracearum TaxID=62708 RepID=A0A420IR72_9PEZI|nr:Metaxin-like protein [Golovinomyces cichoracearum]
MLELHVWGPAFGLPSIDPHCLAAIAYLQQAVPEGQWVVKASSNPALSPTHELPALRDGIIWIGGFRNIFHYLAQHSSGKWILDVNLSEQEGADCVAYLASNPIINIYTNNALLSSFSSFLDATARPLLDLSLYVSGENYTTVTRTAYGTMQPFPLPYITPDAIRSAAQARTQHLGLAYFTIDSEVTSPTVSTKPPLNSILPDNLRRPKHTVSSLLAASPESISQIRLDALASNFFEPIEVLRDKKKFLISDTQITSLDCLALGYLSLMLIPELPQSWLAKTMRRRFPRLSAWTQELRSEIFGGAICIQDVFADRNQGVWNDRLPWQKPENQSTWGRCQLFLSALIEGLPGLGNLKRKNKITPYKIKTSYDSETKNSMSSLMTTIGATFFAVTTAGIYYTLWGRFMINQKIRKIKKDESNGLDKFGDAGNILDDCVDLLDKTPL